MAQAEADVAAGGHASSGPGMHEEAAAAAPLPFAAQAAAEPAVAFAVLAAAAAFAAYDAAAFWRTDVVYAAATFEAKLDTTAKVISRGSAQSISAVGQ